MLAGASHPGSVVTSQSTPTITTPGHRRSRRARGGAGCQAAAVTLAGCCSRGASGTWEVVSLMQNSSREMNSPSQPERTRITGLARLCKMAAGPSLTARSFDLDSSRTELAHPGRQRGDGSEGTVYATADAIRLCGNNTCLTATRFIH